MMNLPSPSKSPSRPLMMSPTELPWPLSHSLFVVASATHNAKPGSTSVKKGLKNICSCRPASSSFGSVKIRQNQVTVQILLTSLI
jgi:hypothetical protein